MKNLIQLFTLGNFTLGKYMYLEANNKTRASIKTKTFAGVITSLLSQYSQRLSELGGNDQIKIWSFERPYSLKCTQ